MAETSWPFDNADTTETQYSQIFRRLISTGVAGTPAGTELKPFGDSSGMQIKVPIGYGFVRGHMYYNDAQKTIAVLTADATARIDTVVMELDPTANTITTKVIKGTAGAGVGPTLTQSDAAVWQEPLADVAVGGSVSTITAGNVTDRRRFNDLGFGLWTTTTRPASPRTGQAGFNTTLAAPEYWDGAAWQSFTPTSINPTSLSSAVPISKGGTGAATKAAALNALGIWINATDPGGVDGDLWFW